MSPVAADKGICVGGPFLHITHSHGPGIAVLRRVEAEIKVDFLLWLQNPLPRGYVKGLRARWKMTMKQLSSSDSVTGSAECAKQLPL